jgi:fucose permease
MSRIGRTPAVMVMTVGLLFSTGVEGGLFTWLTTYADGRVPRSLATVSLSVLLAAYVPGRFVAGSLADRVGYVPLAVAQGTLSLAALAYTLFVASGTAVLVGAFGVGLSLSGVYPTLLAYGTEGAPEHSAPVNAIALVVSSVGIAGAPAAMGVVAGGSGVTSAMRLLFVPLAGLVSVTVIALLREGVVGRVLASVGARE